MSRREDFITDVRNVASAILDARDELVALRAEWDEFMSSALAPGDFQGENQAVDTQVIADVFNSLAAIQAVLAQGHGTNLQKARR